MGQLHPSSGTPDGTVRFLLVKKSVPAEPRAQGRDVGADWGLSTLFTTSDGDHLGQRLYAWLKKRDIELTDLQKALSRRGVRFRDSRRWRRLTARIRGYVRNEIGRVINRLAAPDVRSITVESLDFRGRGLSPVLRRIMSRTGRALVTARLNALAEDHGIVVKRVNPAYTSQTCSGCGYTHRSNRTTQSRFKCGFCHKILHADVNAARNILHRRSVAGGLTYTSRQQVLTHLDRTFQTRWGLDAAEVRERHPRPHSRATPTNATAAAGVHVPLHEVLRN